MKHLLFLIAFLFMFFAPADATEMDCDDAEIEMVSDYDAPADDETVSTKNILGQPVYRPPDIYSWTLVNLSCEIIRNGLNKLDSYYAAANMKLNYARLANNLRLFDNTFQKIAGTDRLCFSNLGNANYTTEKRIHYSDYRVRSPVKS